MILGYEEAAWARQFDYHSLPVEPALCDRRCVRAHTVRLLERLPVEAWSREGRHTQSGRYTAEDWLDIYAEHLEKHAGQIERNLTAWRARTGEGAAGPTQA